MAVWYARLIEPEEESYIAWSLNATGEIGDELDITNADATTVLCANGVSGIEMPSNITCLRLSTAAEGGTAGGSFIVSGNATINGNIVAGTSTCLFLDGSNLTINGNLTSGSTGAAKALIINDICNITINGNITALAANCVDLNYPEAGSVVNITGNIYASTTTGSRHGITVGAATLNITGNLIGGVTGSCGIYSNSSNTITITGNLIGGTGNNSYGLYSASGDVVTVNGDIIGGSTISSYGLYHGGNVSAKCTGNFISSPACFGAAVGKIVRMSTSKSSNYFQLYNELAAVVKLTAATNSNPFRRINKRYGW